jgi:hypothetical protein
MTESMKTAAFGCAALALAVTAAVVQPEKATPEILSDQGAAFFPKFTDPQAPKVIEVVDYDEGTATARPLKVEFQKGRWVIASHYNYRIDVGDRLVKTAAALIDLKKDSVRSDSAQDHAQFGVVDPLDQKVAGLAGRGKRVTLRDAHGDVLADLILGKAVEGKPGVRYVRVPGQKRTYMVKTEADPSARFADWVNAGLVRIARSSIRKITAYNYSIDETAGRMGEMETVVLTHAGGKWASPNGERVNGGRVEALVNTLDSLKIADVRPKPPALAADLRKGQLALSLETAMSLRQRGYFLSPNGRVLAKEGELAVETADGVTYTLRFGEIAASGPDVKPAAGGENRHLFVTAHFDPAKAAANGGDAAQGERTARDLNERVADWYYVISGADFEKLRLHRKDALAGSPAPPRPES